MKKTLYIAAAVIAVMFAASCQKDDVQAVKKGMTLSANIEETKATIDKKEGETKWNFSWELNDVVSVTSPSDGNPYDFTYDGKSFKNADAEPAAGTWTAVYPKSYTTEGISFVNQGGTLESAMKKYLLKGSCESDGSATLNITMNPQVAILELTNSSTQSAINFTIISGGSNAGSRYEITGIDKDGNVIIGSKNSESHYVNVPIGGTKYVVIPVGQYKTDIQIVKTWTRKTGTSAKEIKANHFYKLDVNTL